MFAIPCHRTAEKELEKRTSYSLEGQALSHCTCFFLDALEHTGEGPSHPPSASEGRKDNPSQFSQNPQNSTRVFRKFSEAHYGSTRIVNKYDKGR